MGTKAQLIALIKGEVGHVGGEKYWREAFGWSGGDAPFCATGVTWALKKTNTKCNYFPNPVAFDRRDIGVIGNRWVDRNSLQAGDVVSFDWDGDNGGDHVGFVVEVLGSGTYRTIEFNVSNKVDYRTRYASQIIGGIRPFYDNEKPVSRKLAVDGIFGVNTCKSLQTALQKHGYYKGYLVDGNWGYYSKLALQQYLRKLGYYGTYWLLDGWFGVASVKAMQTYLRALGYYTADYIIDGSWGKYTTIALQKALNDGKF